MQQLGSHGDGLPLGFPLDVEGWGKCVLCAHTRLCPLPIPVRGALGVGEHPLPAMVVPLISLGQLCVVQAAEKARRQTEGH